MKKVDLLPALLRAFFCEWMVEQRNASSHTIRSYRDTWRLFLRFAAQRHHRTAAQLRLTDLTGAEVGAFLRYTERERVDAQRVLAVLGKRLERYGLTLHPDKTRLVDFRPAVRLVPATADWRPCVASLASSPAGNQRQLSNAPKSCAFRPSARHCTPRPTWNLQRLKRSLRSRTGRR